MNQIQIAPVLLASQSRDLYEHELEILEERVKPRILRGRR
jgi:hypothetical protein